MITFPSAELLLQALSPYGFTKEDLVFGEGDPKSSIVLVGEAPGKDEVLQKKPFVGKAGETLSEFLQALDLKRDDIYITNVVKFRPTKQKDPNTKRLSNRPPTKEEIALCEAYLKEELASVSPKLVITLGNIPLQAILNDPKARIGDVHGKIIPLKHFEVFPLYHPASIIYRPELKMVYHKDIQILSGEIPKYRTE